MRKVTLAVIAVLLICLSTSIVCMCADNESLLPFKSAVISYALSGTRTGTEVVYIDVSANKIAIEASVTATIGGMVDKDNTLKIYDGKTAYSVNLDKQTAVKAVKEGEIIPEMFGEKKFLNYYKGEEPFLGKICKVYQSPNGTVYFWQGILLKEDVTMGKNISLKKEAVTILLDVPISQDKFNLPAGVKITDAEQLMKDFNEKFKRK